MKHQVTYALEMVFANLLTIVFATVAILDTIVNLLLAMVLINRIPLFALDMVYVYRQTIVVAKLDTQVTIANLLSATQ